MIFNGQFLPIFITIIYGSQICLGVSSLESINGSLQFLKPPFATSYSNTALDPFKSTVTAMRTDQSSIITAFAEATAADTYKLIDYTKSKDLFIASSVQTVCPSTHSAYVLSSVHKMKEKVTLDASESFLHFTSLATTFGDQSASKSSLVESNVIESTIIQSTIIQSTIIQSNLIESDVIESAIIESNDISSIQINDTETKYADSSNGTTTGEQSHMFALVFGILGCILVLSIAVMIFRNIYRKSKNKVKKIKKKKGRKV